MIHSVSGSLKLEDEPSFNMSDLSDEYDWYENLFSVFGVKVNYDRGYPNNLTSYTINFPFLEGDHVLNFQDKSTKHDVDIAINLTISANRLSNNQASILLQNVMFVVFYGEVDRYSTMMKDLLNDAPLSSAALHWTQL